MKHLWLFLEEVWQAMHVDALQEDRAGYLGVLWGLLEHGVELSAGARARVLAAAWSTREHALAAHLLRHPHWGLPEVLRALKLLDSPRRIRVVEDEIARCNKRLRRPVEPARARNRLRKMKENPMLLSPREQDRLRRRVGVLGGELQNLKREKVKGSLSGALARRVRRWVREIPLDALEFYALCFPLQPWQELADLVHLRQEDFQAPWFLDVVFGKAPPEGTKLAAANALLARLSQGGIASPSASLAIARSSGALAEVEGEGSTEAEAGKDAPLSEEELAEILVRWQLPYNFLRNHVATLPVSARAKLAEYAPLETLLWYDEELCCWEVDEVIQMRLRDGEVPTLGYGKLMERLMVLSRRNAVFVRELLPAARRLLHKAELRLEPPVVVLGDASASMQVAIEVAAIIGSFLSMLTDAQLSFFNQGVIKSPKVPRDILDVLEIAQTVQAQGETSPAAALWPFYQKKRPVRFFLIVTDEEENTPFGGASFAQVFAAYRREVYDAKLVFVSFAKPQQKGPMVASLAKEGISCMRFCLDPKRPDLGKLDAFLGLLAIEDVHFSDRVSALKRSLQAHGGLPEPLPSPEELDQRRTLAHRVAWLLEVCAEQEVSSQRLGAMLAQVVPLASQAGHGALAEDARLWSQALREERSPGALLDGLRHWSDTLRRTNTKTEEA